MSGPPDDASSGAARGAAGLVRWEFADRTRGVSRAPFDRGNLATHVGDDPAAVAANRAALAARLGARRVVGVEAEHGSRAVLVDSGTVVAPPADALLCTEPGLALLVLAADCVPVLLHDADSGLVAVVHAGWRGVAGDVVGAAVAAVREHQQHLQQGEGDALRAVVGPAVCGRCYGVPPARYEQVVAVRPEAGARTTEGGPALDLRVAVLARLAELGVPALRVGGCTREDPRWFSYRRDGSRGPTGRHGGAVVLQTDPTDPADRERHTGVLAGSARSAPVA